MLSVAPQAATAACTLGKIAELPVTMDGLTPTVPATLDGVDVTLIADSGSFFSMLTPQGAKKAGLKPIPAPPNYSTIVGLGGQEQTDRAIVKRFSLAGLTFPNADFLVGAPQLGGGDIDGLLGENVLSYADIEFDLANGAIRLFKPLSCPRDTNFAYWGPGGAATADIGSAGFPAYEIKVQIKVNDHPMWAVIDSGSPHSFISRTAAKQAGVSVDDPGVKPGGVWGGIGRRDFQTWIAMFASFAIGDEQVKNAYLRIGDADPSGGQDGGAQMLIGADFLLSHRVYVANSENKLFFSYIGGPVFNLDDDGAAAAPTAAPTAVAAEAAAIPGAATETPTDADGYARRAAASDARHEYAAAIADYTQAIALAPKAEHNYYARAVDHWRDKEDDAARADLTAAIGLKPDDDEAIYARGHLELDAKDLAAAAADFDAAAKLVPAYRMQAALAYEKAKLFEQSVAQFDLGIAALDKNAPELNVALNDRCWTRALWGQQLDQALADCTAAIARSPDVGSFRDSRGLVNLRLGNYQASIDDYNAALRGDPKLSWSLFGRGVDELRLGQKIAGAADIAAATALDPTLPDTAKGYGVTP
jgi:tetratricopeptide (TPR) repeat protein